MTMPDFSGWLEIKRQIVELTALDRDALHIYAALGIQLATAWLLRWRLTDFRTLIPLAILELANEAADLRYEIWPGKDRGLQWMASLHDIINTFVVPLAIILIARHLSAGRAPRGQ